MLKGIFEEAHVVLDLRASTKAQVLEGLALRAGALLRTPMQPILVALEKREALGSTGLGNGFALPHAEVAGMPNFFALFARLNRPVDFNSIDAKPVDLMFVLLIPEGRAQERIKILASVCRRFRDATVVAQLREAKGEKGIFKVLAEPLSC